MKQGNYFLLSSKNTQIVASAIAPDNNSLDHELIKEIDNLNHLLFELSLVKIMVGKNSIAKSGDISDLKDLWLDYMPNSLAWPLFSEKLKSLITNFLTGNEGIDWIKAVIKSDCESRVYYIPRFSRMLDVLDEQKTVFVKGSERIIEPVFSEQKISNFAIFQKPSTYNLWKITSALYVEETLKKAILKDKLTGISFEKVKTA